MVFVFLWLTSLSIIHCIFIHVVVNDRVSLFMGSIPLCIYITFFTYSSIIRPLCCFHILTIVNNAVVNIGVCVSLWISVCVCVLVCLFSLGKYQEVKLPGPVVVLLLIFGEPPYCFPRWPHQFTFPADSVRVPLFSACSPTLCICWLLVFFDDSHSVR